MEKTLVEIANQFDTDKNQAVNYLANYEHYFTPLRDAPLVIFELGVFHGGSLLMWKEYFPNAIIVGLDLNPNPFPETPGRIHYYQGLQDDEELLERISLECAPNGFDIVIDDASHIGIVTRNTFDFIFNHLLKSRAMYVIEDWGTGYWASWPDGSTYLPVERHSVNKNSSSGRSLGKFWAVIRKKIAPLHYDPNFAHHNFGMVGFIKELVDETAWSDISIPGRGNGSLPFRSSTISELAIFPGQVFVQKA